MRISAQYIVRVASARTFAPLEKAQVRCGALSSMHKDGGFYVFLSPVGGKITVSCPGFGGTVTECAPAGRSTVYLAEKDAEPLSLTALCADNYAAGSREIRAVFTDGFVPQVLDGCTADTGKEKLVILSYDRASGVITAAQPLGGKLAKGSRLVITAARE